MIAKNLAHQAALAPVTPSASSPPATLLNDLAAQDGPGALKRRFVATPARVCSALTSSATWPTTTARRPALRGRQPALRPGLDDRDDQQDLRESNQVFPNAACVVTLVDRLVHNSEIVPIEGQPYRLKEAQEKAAARARERAHRKSAPAPNAEGGSAVAHVPLPDETATAVLDYLAQNLPGYPSTPRSIRPSSMNSSTTSPTSMCSSSSNASAGTTTTGRSRTSATPAARSAPGSAAPSADPRRQRRWRAHAPTARTPRFLTAGNTRHSVHLIKVSAAVRAAGPGARRRRRSHQRSVQTGTPERRDNSAQLQPPRSRRDNHDLIRSGSWRRLMTATIPHGARQRKTGITRRLPVITMPGIPDRDPGIPDQDPGIRDHDARNW